MSSRVDGKRRKKRQYTTRMENMIQHASRIALLVLLSTARKIQAIEENAILPRWGHAAAYIPSPPTLIIQGGKTDPSSSYTYSSSPNTGETLILPLTSEFSTSSPPITSLDTPSAPTSAWHSLTPLSSSDGTWELLSFGGDGGTEEAVQTGSNSAWIMSTNPGEPTVNFTRQESGGDQPMRRIYHSASSATPDGKVYITGGLKDDGSGTTFSDVYSYDSSSSSFSPLPSLPVGLYHHTSVLLPNGTLLALGGAYTSPATGNVALQPYSTIYSLDPTAPSPTWTESQIGGKVPIGRRGATLVMNEEGSKAFLLGGANAGLGEVYGDGWEFDMGSSTWKQVTTGTEGAAARYDHTAVGIGGNQIAVFGGYGPDGPVDSTLPLWDTSTNSWVTSYIPVASASASASSTASSGKSAMTSGISISHGTGTKTKSASGIEPTPSGAATHSSSASTTPSSSSSPTDAGAHSHPLTTPITIGLILGILAVVGILLGLCIWRYRRRRRAKQAALAASFWPGSGPRGRIPSRPYGSREKGGEGLMEELSPEKSIEGGYEAWGVREKGASIGLGMGAIGATLHSISSKFSGKKEDPYAELEEDAPGEIGGPLRKSSRKIGDGIRLLGPRPQREKSLYYSPEKPVRKASMIRNSRIDMFKEEDSSHFNVGPNSRRKSNDEEEDWVIASDESGRNWKSAKSILNNRQSDEEDDNDHDPFRVREDSFDDDAPILPPLRGGPVPTPHESRSDLGTFDEIASMSNPYSELSRNPYSDVSRNRLSTLSGNQGQNYHGQQSSEYHLPSISPSDPLDLAGLLVPPSSLGMNRYSQSSIPTSAKSGISNQSNTLSDAEEGIISEAHFIHSQSPTLVSPSEVAYVPIKRSESFFRRMAAGGITSLLSTSTRSSTQKKELDIRDPAPQPTLWPVISKDLPNPNNNNDSPISPGSSSGNRPPTSWKGDQMNQLVLPTGDNHGKGPSLSSLNSARSMRDMVLVQRETTSSSLESEAIVERSSTPSNHNREYSDDTLATSEENDFLSPISIDTSTLPSRQANESGHLRDANGSPTIGGETPGEIVFNGADFASPPILPSAQLGGSGGSSNTTPRPGRSVTEEPEENDIVNELPIVKSSLRPVPIPAPSSATSHAPSTPNRTGFISLNTPGFDQSPSVSPNPSPLAQHHRRPVREVVNSINKRGGSTPFSLLSPLSNYSPALDRKVSINVTGPSSSSTTTTPFKVPKPNAVVAEDPFSSPITTPKPRERERVGSSQKRPRTIHGSPTAQNSNSNPNSIGGITSPAPTNTRMGKRNTSSGMGDKRPTTMWEVIKRDQLKIANPDRSA